MRRTEITEIANTDNLRYSKKGREHQLRMPIDGKVILLRGAAK